MSGDRRYLAISGVVVLLTVVGMILMLPSSASVAFDVRRSAQRTSPDGVAAWARSLESLERPATMRFDSWVRSRPSGRVEVLLEPIVPPTAEEAGAMMAWLREGGRLVYSPSFGDVVADSLDISLRFELDPTGPRVTAHRWTPGLDATDVPPTFDDVSALGIPGRHGVESEGDGWLPIVEFVAPSRQRGGDEPTSDSTLLAAVGWLPVGDGGVLVIGDAAAIANNSVAESAEAVVATRAVLEWTEPGDAVRFSEYHQGIRGEGSALGVRIRRLGSHPVGRVLLWGVLWSIVAVWVLGRRFGSPIPQGSDPRRSPIEHVRALAEIYRQAETDRLVADRLVTGAARRAGLETRLALDPGRALDWWAAHGEHPELAARSKLAWAQDPPDLSALARALDTLVPASSDP